MKLVSVFKGWNVTDAQLVFSRLEAADFHPVIFNEYAAIEIFGGFGGGLGGVLVQVPENEAADALEFLKPPTANAG
jgi:hypothetical protein